MVVFSKCFVSIIFCVRKKIACHYQNYYWLLWRGWKIFLCVVNHGNQEESGRSYLFLDAKILASHAFFVSPSSPGALVTPPPKSGVPTGSIFFCSGRACACFGYEWRDILRRCQGKMASYIKLGRFFRFCSRTHEWYLLITGWIHLMEFPIFKITYHGWHKQLASVIRDIFRF